jgi:hypothetical protein
MKDILISTTYPPEVMGIFLDAQAVIEVAHEVVIYVEDLKAPSEG